MNRALMLLLAASLREADESERLRKKFANIEAWIVARFDVSQLLPTFRDLRVSAFRKFNDDQDVVVRLDWDESTPARLVPEYDTEDFAAFDTIDPYTACAKMIPPVRKPMRLQETVSGRLFRSEPDRDEYEPILMLFSAFGWRLDKHRGIRGTRHLFRLVKDEPDPPSAYISKLEARF